MKRANVVLILTCALSTCLVNSFATGCPQACQFSFPETINSPGSCVVFVAADDLNGDGCDDLAVVTYTKVAVHLSNGDGTFSAPIEYSLGSNAVAANAVSTGDVDLDGDVDLAVTSEFGASIVRNLGDGTFNEGEFFFIGSKSIEGVEDSFLSDVDGDLDPDLIVVRSSKFSSDEFISVFENNGNGGFQSGGLGTQGVDGRIGSIDVADIDGDSDFDIAVGHGGGGNVTIFTFDNGSLQDGQVVQGGFASDSVVFADMDLDDDQDLVITTALSGSPETRVFSNDGQGNFQKSSSIVGVGFRQIITADFNGDCFPDIAGLDSINDQISVLLNDQTGMQSNPAQCNIAEGSMNLDVGDFDNDGRIDVTVGHLVFRPKVGDMLFASLLSNQSIVLGDVNGDGDVDLLDVQPFVSTIISGRFSNEADINGDNAVDLLDIAPFVLILGCISE